MARPRAALPPRAEAPLLAEAATLAARIEAAQVRLRDALLAGEGTAPIRADLADLEHRADAVGVELLQIADQILELANAEVEAAAKAMADGLGVRLAALVASLQAPPPPTWV
jgi:hypothetical protein